MNRDMVLTHIQELYDEAEDEKQRFESEKMETDPGYDRICGKVSGLKSVLFRINNIHEKEYSMTDDNLPRIGNRSDALDLLDKIVEEIDDVAGSSGSTGVGSLLAASLANSLVVLRDALYREII